MKQAQRQWIWTPTTEQEIKSMPFKECAVDLIGPWIVQVHGKPLEFNALTAIDTITNLVELVRIDNKTSDHIAQQLSSTLSHRRCPSRMCVPAGERKLAVWYQILHQIN